MNGDSDRENKLREWIASSLEGGYNLDQLKQVLVKIGFAPEEVEKEFVSSTAYMEIVQKFRKKIDAREALLKTLDYQKHAMPHYLGIKKVSLPPFEQFLEEYYYPNRVGFFSNVLDNCEARHWTPQSLVDKVGANTLIEIQDGFTDNIGDKQCTRKIRFAEFVNRLGKTKPECNYYLSGAVNCVFNNKPLKSLMAAAQNIGDGYFPVEGIQMFFIGPEKIVVPLHHDFKNNLFIQIYGRKHFRIVPAMQVSYLYSDSIGACPVDPVNPKLGIYADFSRTTVIDIEVGPGDGLFIPIGWWHHVTSLSVSISMSCTNFNTPENCPNVFIEHAKGW